MAVDTQPSTRNLVIYEVYVRNHQPNGTFAAVEADLPRIKSMGVDVIWFMPIHPIGEVERKGILGSPYSISDYRAINPEYGDIAQFTALINRAHHLGLKVWIDVVFNHTAHDSILVKDHPEWFHQDASGNPVTTVPDWSDVIDLKHPNEKLSDYLIESLKYWAGIGVDGFRCDVASLLPKKFWLRARREVASVNPDVVWLAESVHASFVAARRDAGLPTLSDGEIFEAFDIAYDYDIWPTFQTSVLGITPSSRYLEMLRLQDAIYPENFVKMRCAENHDQARIMALAPTKNQALAWTAFQAFNKGAFMIYAGQEAGARHTPSLFDTDPIDWQDYPLQPFLTSLAQLKKHPAMLNGRFVITRTEPAVVACWVGSSINLLGIFNTDGKSVGASSLPVADGDYTNLLTSQTVTIKDGQCQMPAYALIIETKTLVSQPQYFLSELLNFHMPADRAENQ